MTMSTEVMVNGVLVKNRARTDLGDLSKLAASIAARGLLNPIVVDRDHVLICGQRRLEAVKTLGHEMIEARIVETAAETLDALLMESDENELREPFKPSEAIAMKRMIEAKFAPEARQKELMGNALTKDEPSQDILGGSTNRAREIRRARETSHKTAKALGFGSEFTMKQAENVVQSGVPELVTLMDNGAVTINMAAKLATLPADEQKAAIDQGKDAIKQAARAVKATKNPPGPKSTSPLPTTPPPGPPPQMSARVQRIRIRSALDSIFREDPDAVAVLQEIKRWVDDMLAQFTTQENTT